MRKPPLTKTHHSTQHHNRKREQIRYPITTGSSRKKKLTIEVPEKPWRLASEGGKSPRRKFKSVWQSEKKKRNRELEYRKEWANEETTTYHGYIMTTANQGLKKWKTDTRYITLIEICNARLDKHEPPIPTERATIGDMPRPWWKKNLRLALYRTPHSVIVRSRTFGLSWSQIQRGDVMDITTGYMYEYI